MLSKLKESLKPPINFFKGPRTASKGKLALVTVYRQVLGMEALIQVTQAAVTPLHHPLGINKEIGQSQDNVVLTVHYMTRQLCNNVIFTVHFARHLQGRVTVHHTIYALPTLLPLQTVAVLCVDSKLCPFSTVHAQVAHSLG